MANETAAEPLSRLRAGVTFHSILPPYLCPKEAKPPCAESSAQRAARAPPRPGGVALSLSARDAASSDVLGYHKAP